MADIQKVRMGWSDFLNLCQACGIASISPKLISTWAEEMISDKTKKLFGNKFNGWGLDELILLRDVALGIIPAEAKEPEPVPAEVEPKKRGRKPKDATAN